MKVHGTMQVVEPVEFDGQKVRVRTNIERVTIENEHGSQEMWEYDEEIISLDELQFRKTMGEL